jgi:aminoglycoside phosphotransferase (APT) family kinase protein
VDNRSFRLGDDLLVRLPAGEWYAHQVVKEQTWLPRLAPQLPVPIPEPITRGAATPSYPYPWSIYRWIAASPRPRRSPTVRLLNLWRDSLLHYRGLIHVVAQHRARTTSFAALR